ncbi:MAG TPA: hypothetical protein VEH77_01870 [Roseiarcus sp.]|nr:hypothetical protein [Roseiarcus sp.]
MKTGAAKSRARTSPGKTSADRCVRLLGETLAAFHEDLARRGRTRADGGA